MHADDAEYLKNGQEKVALGFDLSRPIKPQVEEARRLLLVLQRHQQKAGKPCPYTLATARERWTLYLRVLDAESAAARPDEAASLLFPGDSDRQTNLERTVAEAHAMIHGGYRAVLLMPET